MTPFDIEAAKSGAPVCTKDGNEVLLIRFLDEGDYPILAIIGNGVCNYGSRYTNDGVYVIGKESGCDLMMK